MAVTHHLVKQMTLWRFLVVFFFFPGSWSGQFAASESYVQSSNYINYFLTGHFFHIHYFSFLHYIITDRLTLIYVDKEQPESNAD